MYRILFMDDESDIRRVIPLMLRMEGIIVEEAADGKEAIDIYKKKHNTPEAIDLVILDLNVKGGMGGREAFEGIRKIDPEAMAILSTGFSYDPVSTDYKKHGFSDIISKPYNIEELLEKMRRILK